MYSVPCQTSKMERRFSPLTIFAKRSILDVWQGSEYASACKPLGKYLFKVNSRHLNNVHGPCSGAFIVDIKEVFFPNQWVEDNSAFQKCLNSEAFQQNGNV